MKYYKFKVSKVKGPPHSLCSYEFHHVKEVEIHIRHNALTRVTHKKCKYPNFE